MARSKKARDRCCLQGALGDALHALSCAAGYNIRWLLRAIARLGVAWIFCALKFAGRYASIKALETAWTDKLRQLGLNLFVIRPPALSSLLEPSPIWVLQGQLPVVSGVGCPFFGSRLVLNPTELKRNDILGNQPRSIGGQRFAWTQELVAKTGDGLSQIQVAMMACTSLTYFQDRTSFIEIFPTLADAGSFASKRA